MSTTSHIRVCSSLFILLLTNLTLTAAPLTFVPVELVQPDGTVLTVFASGDEFYHWMHDKDNYTIIRDPVTHYFVYAVQGKEALLPSHCIAGRDDPAAAGLAPGANVVPPVVQERAAAEVRYASALSKTGYTGSKYNLVVFVRFKNETEFTGTVSEYDQKLNSATGPSLRQYYSEVSWNQVTVTSSIVQASGTAIASYQDDQTRNYYLLYDSLTNPTGYINDRGTRENSLLRKALTAVQSQVPSSVNLDGDGDGRIDNVIFIVSGSAAGWSNLLWPHMSSLSSSPAFVINGKTVSTYNFQLEKSFSVGVLCHEMGHSFGMPDLYRYTNTNISPCGSWDIMCSGSAHMSNYLKYTYGKWITSIPQITASGTYWLRVSTSTSQNVYKIPSARSTREYYILEYRKKSGLYESGLPGSGLIVYRINERAKGNASGPPDEVYVYRPGGTLAVNGTTATAYFSLETGRTAINDTTNPASFLSDGLAGGLSLSNIGSAAGDSIRFDVSIITSVPVKTDYAAAKAAYSWIDIAANGTAITNWMNATASLDSSLDDGYTSSPIPLGFDFTFFGQKFNSLNVGINGLVSFTQKALNIGTSGGASLTEFGHFSSTVTWPGNMLFPNSIAAAYCDFDLNPKDTHGGGRILYKTIGDQFVLSWINVGTFNQKNDTTNTFQLVLNKSGGAVTVNFKNFGLYDTRLAIKVGMQKDLANGVSWVDNADIADHIPANGTSVVFTPLVTSVTGRSAPIPMRFALEQNFPNPFNPSTTIRYAIAQGAAGHVALRLYDMLGRVAAVLVDRMQGSGTYDAALDGSRLASGIYICRLDVTTADGVREYTASKKVVLMK